MSGGYYGSNDLTSVELIREDGTTCNLPSMSVARRLHSQSGLVACGGDGEETTCSTFKDGFWLESHTLGISREYHTSWNGPEGVLLLGGWAGNAHTTTELLSSSASNTTPGFTLPYSTRWVHTNSNNVQMFHYIFSISDFPAALRYLEVRVWSLLVAGFLVVLASPELSSTQPREQPLFSLTCSSLDIITPAGIIIKMDNW